MPTPRRVEEAGDIFDPPRQEPAWTTEYCPAASAIPKEPRVAFRGRERSRTAC